MKTHLTIKTALILAMIRGMVTKNAALLLFVLVCLEADAQGPAGLEDLRVLSQQEFSALGEKSPGRVNKRPVILTFRHRSGGRLFYYGSSHTFNLKDPVLQDISNQWNAFGPDVVFWEGGNPDRPKGLPLTLEAVVRESGEAGLVRYLARERGIADRTLEPAPLAVIDGLRKKFSDREILVHGLLTQVEQASRKGSSDAVLDSIVLSGIKRAGAAGFKYIPEDIAQFSLAVTELVPGLGNWHRVQLDMVAPKPLEDTRTTRVQSISTESSLIRDRHMLNVLLAEVAKGKRVFAVVGASHVIMQEPGLCEFFGKRYRE